MTTISAEGLALIKRFEGLRLEAYLCPAGKWTLGYGHTGGVSEGMKITEEQAEELLKKDLAHFEKGVAAMLDGQFVANENEFSALVSLAFNIGLDALKGSSVMTFLRIHGDRKLAARAFLLWNKATVNGKKVTVPGLTRRREAERALFLKPVAP